MAFNGIHRRFALLSLNEPIDAILYNPPAESIYMGFLTLEVDYLQKTKKPGDEFKKEDLTAILMRDLMPQCFTLEQKFVVDYQGNNLEFRVVGVETVNLSALAKGENSANIAMKSTRDERIEPYLFAFFSQTQR